MKDLYEELGVPKDATPAEIRKAYLAKAKTLHPDHGGDEEAFKRASHAHLILSNADKREHYDRTGGEQTASPEEREMAEALSTISKMLAQIFTMAEYDPALHDPRRAIKKLLKIERKEAEEARENAVRIRMKIEKTIKRVRRKKGVEEAARLEKIMETMIRDMQKNIEKAERAIRVCEKARDVLNEVDYEVDPPPKATPEEEAAASAMAAIKNHINLKFGGGKFKTVPDPDAKQSAAGG